MAGSDCGCVLLPGGRREEQVHELRQLLPSEDIMWLTVTLASLVLFILQNWRSIYTEVVLI